MIEDDYVPGLEPYRHFLPVKKDFSNVDQVFSFMRDDGRAASMIEATYQHLIASGRFSYKVFVDLVRPSSRADLLAA